MPRRPKTAALARISMPNPMRTLTRHAYLSLRGCAAAFAVHVAAIAFVLNAGILTAAAQTCTTEDFARAVDRAGEALRNFNAENGPKVTAALKTLQKKRGWSDRELEEKAVDFLHTARIAELDERATELLTKIDTLGDVAGMAPDCARLPELEAAGRNLLAIMREKAELSNVAIAAAVREGEEEREVAARPAQPAGSARPAPAAKPMPPPGNSVRAPERKGPAPGEAAQATPGSWDAAMTRVPTEIEPGAAVEDGAGSTAAGDTLSLPDASAEPGYTIDEIKAATRGFFGTISTNLGGVIEYAFSNYGRPSAYVLGSEGGGAFLAGARYGKGKLYMRMGGQRQVYWHGPSLGYDFGAEGSRTLFLIYRLKSENDLFRRYGGVDGSAYVLGGVGLTVLKGGPVLMTPIRTGVGLRLGANIGYVRFTPHATWNPF